MNTNRHAAYLPYLYGMTLVGSAVVVLSLIKIGQGLVSQEWIILASLTVLTGSFTVRIPGVNSKISIADTFVFTNIILFGVYAGIITAALDGFIGSIRSRSISRRREYLLFNVGAMALCAFFAAKTFFLLLGRGPLYQGVPVTLEQIIIPVLAMALVHYLSNSISVATIVALDLKKNIFAIWRESYLWTSITYFSGASVAALIAINVNSITPAVLGIIIPVLLILYFTYKTYLDKVEESVKHLEQLSKLYLSTVETLAMAIDAKDQVTHGHVRRVQVYAKGLAKAMGITDENTLRGIEAAALLHDVGKLAIPEYILNKPGELTPNEFQKMMIHPGVGSDILSSISFPYPVAEYVRHHHERWDGSGYPDRLKGTQIPLGARVLAVADCYEALICDRPYRSGFSREEAMQIISSRAGSHYDAEVVNKFSQILDTLDEEVQEIEVHELNVGGLKAIAETARDTERLSAGSARGMLAFQDISSANREVFALYEMAQTLGSTLNLQETLLIIASRIEKIVPSVTCVIYLYSPAKGCLTASHVSGANMEAFKGYAMELGENLSGWVAAHTQPAVNADPVLDVLPLKDRITVQIDNSLVYPLKFEDKCLGTISLYGSNKTRFKDDHLRAMEIVSKQAAMAIHNVIRFEETQEDAFTDRLTLLPNSRYLYLYCEQELEKAVHFQYPLTVMELDLDGFNEINNRYGHAAGDRMLIEVAKILKSNLRGSDVVVRYAGDEFIAVMSQTTLKDASLLAKRIQSAIDQYHFEVRPSEHAHIGISVGLACYPTDGDNLEKLMTKANEEMYCDKKRRTHTSSLILHEVKPAIQQLELKRSSN